MPTYTNNIIFEIKRFKGWKSFDHKMSKSDPGGAILIHDEPKRLRKKMQKHAYLNTEDENSPIYELAEHVILPEFGEIIVTP